MKIEESKPVFLFSLLSTTIIHCRRAVLPRFTLREGKKGKIDRRIRCYQLRNKKPVGSKVKG